MAGKRRSASWSRTAKNGSTWWSASWRSSSCTVKGRSSFSRLRPSARSRLSGRGEAAVTDDMKTHDTRALEALLFVSDEPLTSSVIAQALDLDRQAVDRSCHRLASDLEDRGLIAEAGRDAGPGRPLLYGTTPQVLGRLGLPSLAALPSLAPLLSGGAADLDDPADLAVRGQEVDDGQAGVERPAEPGDG